MFAEFLGTAFLVAGVIGSGIAASRLSPNDVGLQLLENAVATGAMLVAIILAVGAVSGAHLNPVITIVDRCCGGVSNIEASGYVLSQTIGALCGAVVANAMFDLPLVAAASEVRTGTSLWTGEVVATVGLVLVVFGVVRSGRSSVAPFAVGAYITGAYFFTSSTSFANPAVTLGRSISDSFAGIAPSAVPGFVLAQCAGGVLGLVIVRLLYPTISHVADEVVLPHSDTRS